MEVSDDGVIVVVDSDGNLQVGCDLNALGVLDAWTEAGALEFETFNYGCRVLTFERDVQPFFTEAGMWFEGSQACSSCNCNSDPSCAIIPCPAGQVCANAFKPSLYQ